MDSRYPRVILAKGKNPVGSRPRLPVAVERNFRDVHRRAGQQLLSLTGRVSQEEGVVPLSLGCLNLKN